MIHVLVHIAERVDKNRNGYAAWRVVHVYLSKLCFSGTRAFDVFSAHSRSSSSLFAGSRARARQPT